MAGYPIKGGPVQRQVTKGNAGLRLLAKAWELSGVPQLASDAYWSFTHPIDRLTGKGRASTQLMMWPGEFKLRPAPRIPTANPEWEIIRNKAGDEVIGLTGPQHYPGPLPRNWRVSATMYNRNVARRLWENHLRQYGPNMNPEQTQRARELISTLARYNQELEGALAERPQRGLDLSFSAVPAGTRHPGATLEMEIKRNETYVPSLADRNKVPASPDAPPFVPPQVMMELMSLALAPEKPVHALVINPKLARVMATYARRKGLNWIDDGFFGYVASQAPRQATRPTDALERLNTILDQINRARQSGR